MGCCEGAFKENDLIIRDSESRLKTYTVNRESVIKNTPNGLSPKHNTNSRLNRISPFFNDRGEHQTSPISFVPTLELPENPCEVSISSWSGINKT